MTDSPLRGKDHYLDVEVTISTNAFCEIESAIPPQHRFAEESGDLVLWAPGAVRLHFKPESR